MSKENSPTQDRNAKVIQILIIVLLLLLIGALAMFTFNNMHQEEDTTPPQENEQAEQREDPDLEEDKLIAETEEPSVRYAGEHLSVLLPEGWKLVEYKDGENTAYLAGGVTYTGLTGFAIIDPTNNVAYKANGASGIGGVAYCEKYYMFAEYDVAHYNSKVTSNSELGEAAPVMVDLSTTDYAEFEVLGVSMRRIGNTFYWDEVSTGSNFEAACANLDMQIPPYEGISFDADGYESTAYMSEITLAPGETAKLELLDGILGSLEVI